jgi:integrase
MSMKAVTENELQKWEHPKGSKIFIREIINLHDGEAFNGSYMVTIPGRVTGTGRKRRQFKDKGEAQEWASLEYKGAAKQGEDYFKATADERRQFVEVLPDLREKGLSLKEAVDFALPRLRPEGGSKTVTQLVTAMVASKQARYEQGKYRERSLRDFRTRSERFSEFFGDCLIGDLTKEDIKAWVQSLELSGRSNKNYLDVVSELLKHAMQSRLILENPLDFLTDLERKELCGSDLSKEPAILSVNEAELLMNAAYEHRELGLLPFITLGLFCGLRTEEIKRLNWENVHLDDDTPFVTVGADIAKKGRIRNIDIPENAQLWLSLCRKDRGEIIANPYLAYLYRRLHKLLENAGIGEKTNDGEFKTRWENNSMRHSFGSYHFALHGDSLETSRLLGHKAGDAVLFAHYRALAKKSDGEKFFAIKPAASAAKIVEFSA